MKTVKPIKACNCDSVMYIDAYGCKSYTFIPFDDVNDTDITVCM